LTGFVWLNLDSGLERVQPVMDVLIDHACHHVDRNAVVRINVRMTSAWDAV